MIELLSTPEAWVALLTLIALETVLGIDNIVFISVLVGGLPDAQRARARQIGIALALLLRLLLLFSLAWLTGLVEPLFSLFGEAFSGRDLILIGGGLFLLGKATHEIHNSLEVHERAAAGSGRVAGFGMVIAQIAVIDMVFSLDSVITAIGLVSDLRLMVIAILFSMVVMLMSARPISEFVDRHPTFKMLALAFLILIGCTLVAEGFEMHIPRGYIYFAMAFSISVELLNLWRQRNSESRQMRLQKKMPLPDGQLAEADQ